MKVISKMIIWTADTNGNGSRRQTAISGYPSHYPPTTLPLPSRYPPTTLPLPPATLPLPCGYPPSTLLLPSGYHPATFRLPCALLSQLRFFLISRHSRKSYPLYVACSCLGACTLLVVHLFTSSLSNFDSSTAKI